jgi:hypothetical protein
MGRLSEGARPTPTSLVLNLHKTAPYFRVPGFLNMHSTEVGCILSLHMNVLSEDAMPSSLNLNLHKTAPSYPDEIRLT